MRNKSLICSKRFALYSPGSLLLLRSLLWVIFTPGDASRELIASDPWTLLLFNRLSRKQRSTDGALQKTAMVVSYIIQRFWSTDKDSTWGIFFPCFQRLYHTVSCLAWVFPLLPVIFRLTGRVSRNYGSHLCLLTGKEYFQQRCHRFQASQLNEKLWGSAEAVRSKWTKKVTENEDSESWISDKK